MVYSAWRILFSIISDMVNANPKTTYERQWNLLHDLSILTKPHVLKEEGYPVILARTYTANSQRKGIYIFSLRELEIGRPYVTKGDTCIVRASPSEVQMGEIFSSDKEKNGIVTIRIPLEEEICTPEKLRSYKPTISGILVGEIMLLALEQFTNRKLCKGLSFFEHVEGNVQCGRTITSLDQLSPNISYVSEDYTVKLKRRTGGRYCFFFAGYNVGIIPDENEESFDINGNYTVPDEEPFPNISVESVVADFLQKEEEKENAEDDIDILSLSDDEEFKEIMNSLELVNNTEPELESNTNSIPPPPPCLPLPPPPPPGKGRLTNCETPNRRKMRPLRWSKIPKHQLKETLWGQEKSPVRASVINVKEKDLEKLFSISPVNSPARKLGKRTIQKKKLLLPVKRANNISIVLSKLPEINEILNCILLESENSLSIDQLNSLSSLLPFNEEEISLVRNSLIPYESLSKAEQFVYTLSQIERIDEKVDCLRFMLLLKEDYDTVMPKIKTLALACKEAKSSKGLRNILKLILQIGSILNRDTYLSGNGFRLQSLKSIAETKAKCGGVTLVHYLSQLIGEHEPELLYFLENEIPHCYEASRISMDVINLRVKEVSQQIKLVEKELSYYTSGKENITSDNQDIDKATKQFASSLSQFYTKAQKQVDAMEKSSITLKKLYIEVGTYFGEYPSDDPMSSVEFFTIIHQFSEMLLQTKSDNRAVKMMQQLVDTPSPVSSPIKP